MNSDNSPPPNFELFADIWINQDQRIPEDEELRAKIREKMVQILANRYQKMHPEAKLKLGVKFQIEESLLEPDQENHEALLDHLMQEFSFLTEENPE